MNLVCAAVILVGLSSPEASKLTAPEKQVLETAQAGCKKYFSDAPCLKVLTKKGDNYNVICGPYNSNTKASK